MNPFKTTIVISFSVLIMSSLSTHLFAQEDAKPVQKETKDLTLRVADLEQRVVHLERLLFSTAQLSVYDAERRLRDARERLEQTRRLFLKGILLRNQVAYDEFVVRRAEKELQLARALNGQFQITAEIDLLQAEFELQTADRQLRLSRERLTRGFVTPEQIRRQESAVQRATKAMATANEKLKAIKEAKLSESNK